MDRGSGLHLSNQSGKLPERVFLEYVSGSVEEPLTMLAELLAMRDADTLSASALPEGLDAWVKHVEEQASPLLAPKGVRKETDRLACWLHGKNVSVSSKGGRLTWNETTTRLKGREGAGGRQASMSSAKSKNRKSQQRPEETPLDAARVDTSASMDNEPADQDTSSASAGESSVALKQEMKAPSLRLDVAAMSRRSFSHSNEDRHTILEFTDLLSQKSKEDLLCDSRTSSISLFAVFDGHGGDAVSEMASKQLAPCIAQALQKIMSEEGLCGKEAIDKIPVAMERGFAEMEHQTETMFESSGEKSGTCAVVLVLCEYAGTHVVHVANLGDCRAVLAHQETAAPSAKMHPVRLTTDHRATVHSESVRIQACGGQVEDKRALGVLIPSRTLGDINTKLKCPGAISAVPELSHHTVSFDDTAIILASDGLWDEVKLPQVMEAMQKTLTPDNVIKKLSKAVLKSQKKPNDDLTIIVVKLLWE